ncbi:hypothetical protein ACIBUY_30870 [Streptomyces sp. NPDC050085]|uniref:hypothetical protein n=1 Tax=Streptomyces sp. NPDC050085 TaxID=3365600 RepID=UPI0037879B5C
MTQPIQPVSPVPEVLPPVSELPQPPLKKDRRVLRAALRWTAAVVVFAALGAGTAYGVMERTRGDLPGLATESDGRWEYPAIQKPALPKGAPAVFAEGNSREEHYADLRALLLPAPKGAVEDKALAGKDGWLPSATYLAEYEKDVRGELAPALKDGGLRHIAARGWTMPDGTHTRIYLLRFTTRGFAHDYRGAVASNSAALIGAPDTVEDYSWAAGDLNENPYTVIGAQEEKRPYGKEQVRQAFIEAGDVYALVVQSRKGTTAKVPFQQTVVLQNQLLG